MATILRSVTGLLVGLVIYVALPLIGWGVTDVPGFLSHPVRLAYVVLVILLQLFVVVRFPGVGRNRGAGTRTVGRQRWAVLLLQILSLAILFAAPYGDRRALAALAGSAAVRALGLLLFASGFLLISWAEASLGDQFSIQVTVQRGHKLVTDGLYRYLRHPRYLGILLYSLGVSLTFASWLALILVAALTLVLLWRIHDEEAFMHQEFGAAWEAYCKKSWRLLPFLF